MTSQFSRTELLLGREAMDRLAAARVILFGVGGVGSWCAEGLIRSGLGNLTIVDADVISESNINRQLMATVSSIGRVKVEALREHLLDVNPSAAVTAVNRAYCDATAGEFDLSSYGYVVDAIDSLASKALLIERACLSDARLFSSMGSALKTDPTGVRVAEFWEVKGDPLARTLRKRFRKQGVIPEKPFKCVYSEELLQNKGEYQSPDDDPGLFRKACVNGTTAHVTAIFGFTLAGLVIEDIIGKA